MREESRQPEQQPKEKREQVNVSLWRPIVRSEELGSLTQELFGKERAIEPQPHGVDLSVDEISEYESPERTVTWKSEHGPDNHRVLVAHLQGGRSYTIRLSPAFQISPDVLNLNTYLFPKSVLLRSGLASLGSFDTPGVNLRPVEIPEKGLRMTVHVLNPHGIFVEKDAPFAQMMFEHAPTAQSPLIREQKVFAESVRQTQQEPIHAEKAFLFTGPTHCSQPKSSPCRIKCSDTNQRSWPSLN